MPRKGGQPQRQRQGDAGSQAARPLFLPVASPPEKNPVLLGISLLLFVAWLVFLSFLAL